MAQFDDKPDAVTAEENDATDGVDATVAETVTAATVKLGVKDCVTVIGAVAVLL